MHDSFIPWTQPTEPRGAPTPQGQLAAALYGPLLFDTDEMFERLALQFLVGGVCAVHEHVAALLRADEGSSEARAAAERRPG